jgi:non-ribosomal peptide synthetase component E (peptide arylation enzyme)
MVYADQLGGYKGIKHVHEAHPCQSYYRAGGVVRPKSYGWRTVQGRNPTPVVWAKSEQALITITKVD